MIVEFDAVSARVVHGLDAEIDWLAGYLCFPNPKAFFSGGPRHVSQFNPRSRIFPAGYLPLVVKAAAEEDPKIVVSLVDKRQPPALESAPDLAWLRDYQREAFDVAMAKTRGILWMPTGSGKTEVMVALTRAVEGEWLMIAHRMTLAQQAAARWRSRNPGVSSDAVGVIGEGQWTEGWKLTCATFQSLKAAMKSMDDRALALLRRVVGLVVDEAHVLPADSFLSVAQRCRAHYRIGLSATPLARGDRRSVLAIGQLGPVIYKLKPERLMEAGAISRPKIRMVPVHQPEMPQHDWRTVYETRIVNSDYRNAVVVAAALRCAKPALLFVQEIAHGRILSRALWRAGLKNELVHGEHSSTHRTRLVKRLERGELDVLVSSGILDAGIDIPSLRGVIPAQGLKSVIATLQKLGRGSRVDRDAAGNVKDGGDTFEVWDFDDRGTGWLEDHSAARRKAYIAEGYELIQTPLLIVAK